MLDANLPPLTFEEAHKILKHFDCLQLGIEGKEIEYNRLRQALLLVVDQSDYQILGICSATFAQGCQALRAYAQALGYPLSSNLQAIDGAIYIKFNPRLESCYVDAYNGAYRGVLVACQSDNAAGINEMYGHLPLDLFEEPENRGSDRPAT